MQERENSMMHEEEQVQVTAEQAREVLRGLAYGGIVPTMPTAELEQFVYAGSDGTYVLYTGEGADAGWVFWSLFDSWPAVPAPDEREALLAAADFLCGMHS
jgi:hypothetical protein